jgi:NADPH:quinone reductase
MHELGGPEVLRWDAVDVPKPGPGQVRIKHTAIALNYMDVYYRIGLYPAQLPIVLGNEAAGVVEEVGPGVTGLDRGDRVAYVTASVGAYSEARVIPADQLVKLPENLSDTQGAAMMMKGLTARYLVRESYLVKRGDTILVHAAAGGVGLVMCQWASHLGATVIGTVSSEEKAALAKAHGCTHTIDYTREDFVQRVQEITAGRKLPVVYDSVGKDTFSKSLECLAPKGVMVVFGHSSGKVPPFDLLTLGAKGSLYVTRPTLWTHLSTRAELVSSASELFDLVTRGIIKITVNQTYPLKEAQRAHRDLESRKTTGASVMTL